MELYEIHITSDLFDDKKKARSYLFEQLNTCFLMYRVNFGINPDTIVFNGKYAKQIHKLLHDLFDGVYECTFNEHWCNSIEFRSRKTPKIHVDDANNESIPMEPIVKKGNDVMPGLYTGSASDLYQMMSKSYTSGITYTMEKDIETVAEFPIIDDTPVEPVENNNLLGISFF